METKAKILGVRRCKGGKFAVLDGPGLAEAAVGTRFVVPLIQRGCDRARLKIVQKGHFPAAEVTKLLPGTSLEALVGEEAVEVE